MDSSHCGCTECSECVAEYQLLGPGQQWMFVTFLACFWSSWKYLVSKQDAGLVVWFRRHSFYSYEYCFPQSKVNLGHSLPQDVEKASGLVSWVTRKAINEHGLFKVAKEHCAEKRSKPVISPTSFTVVMVVWFYVSSFGSFVGWRLWAQML